MKFNAIQVIALWLILFALFNLLPVPNGGIIVSVLALVFGILIIIGYLS